MTEKCEIKRKIDAYVTFVPSAHGVLPKGVSRVLDWWHRWADPEFGHCSILIKEQGVDIYCELQVWHSAITFSLFTSDFVDEYIMKSGYSRIIKCDLDVDLAPYRPRLMVTCVSVVKHALGIHAPMVLTPRQLYRRLLATPGCTRLL